jgi:hypothetical protein
MNRIFKSKKTLLLPVIIIVIIILSLTVGFLNINKNEWTLYKTYTTTDGNYSVILKKQAIDFSVDYFKIKIICRNEKTGKEVIFTTFKYSPPENATRNGLDFNNINADKSELIISDYDFSKTYEFVWADIF